MGVVYAARDDRLERTIALKTLPALGNDDTAQQRLWREARAAARVNHPNICQIYEIGEDGGRLFIAMELLEGEALADRLRRGPVSASETVPIGLGMLAALSALHARGIVHRDLKPSNVFLTVHGVKVLDFGLARPELDGLADSGHRSDTHRDGDGNAAIHVARAGERRAGGYAQRSLRRRRHPLRDAGGTSGVQRPQRRRGPPRDAVRATAGAHRRAGGDCGRPRDSPGDGQAPRRAIHIRRCHGRGASRHQRRHRHCTHPGARDDTLGRSAVPHPAIRSRDGLSRLQSARRDCDLVIGQPLADRALERVAARFGAETPDLRALSAEADVDRVVMGTLLRAGDQLRAAVQLIEAPAGTLLTSHTVQSSMGDLFRLQDDIARRVSEALSLPLSGETAASQRDTPHDARAYELYLRANELARTYDGLPAARELYQQCLELDSRFAPAWAHLGRCHRVIGKYIDDAPDSEARAEDAFRRALALNPRLSIAHKFYSNLEADIGQAQGALVRLLGEAGRHGNDPELFAGLVHACRYGGLYDQSIGAHVEARRLDPNVPTSFETC